MSDVQVGRIDVVDPRFERMAVGEDGALWVSAGDGVHHLTADGELLGRI